MPAKRQTKSTTKKPASKPQPPAPAAEPKKKLQLLDSDDDSDDGELVLSSKLKKKALDSESDSDNDDAFGGNDSDDGGFSDDDDEDGDHSDGDSDDDDDDDAKKPTILTPEDGSTESLEYIHDLIRLWKSERHNLDVFDVSDLSVLFQRIQNVVALLARYRTDKRKGEERKDFVRLLQHDVETYYGYNAFLTNLFMQMFQPGELIEFLEANEAPRPTTLRVNTLRARRRDVARSLIDRGVNLDPIKWSDVGLQVFDSSVPLGATPEYLAGQYMLQGAASFLPVVALDPQPHERVLDMCAAPGGKTTYIAALMKNTGQLFANELSRERCASLTANIHRLGVKNCIVTCMNGIDYARHINGFDRILLDAPCSGLGVISRDPSVKVNRTEEDIQRSKALQQQLLMTAVDMLKPGGTVVYSTCSVAIQENEEVVDFVISRRKGLKVVPVELSFGTPGFTRFRSKRMHDTIKHSRRFYPHLHNTDGFYFCKLQWNPPPKTKEDVAAEREAQEKRAKANAEKKEKEGQKKKKNKFDDKKRQGGKKFGGAKRSFGGDEKKWNNKPGGKPFGRRSSSSTEASSSSSSSSAEKRPMQRRPSAKRDRHDRGDESGSKAKRNVHRRKN